MFDLPDNVEIDDVSIQKMQEELDVSISIKPKQRQANKSVMIKAQVRILLIRYKFWARIKVFFALGEERLRNVQSPSRHPRAWGRPYKGWHSWDLQVAVCFKLLRELSR